MPKLIPPYKNLLYDKTLGFSELKKKKKSGARIEPPVS